MTEFQTCLHARHGQKTNAVASFVCFKRHLFGGLGMWGSGGWRYVGWCVSLVRESWHCERGKDAGDMGLHG